jgi:serine/threonine protein kinase
VLSATKREGAGQPPADPVRFDPVPGAVVDGKYRVERLLGEGGMGVVVSAIHLGLEQEVAIKFLLPEAMRSKVAVERFLREAKVAAKVRSEYVARVHDVGKTAEGGVPYIVMEHLDGLDLGKLIDRDGALRLEEACEIGLQACEALGEVHAAGIVHRDLKPSNLFVTRRADGSPAVKLLDFGISKLTFGGDDPGIDPALTQTATIMGSPSYMSPEQLKSTKEVDHRADVWSLGAVLYEAITGKPAFRGETLPQVCAMIASETPVAPSAVKSGVPSELDRIILRCLEKNPDQRAELVDLARTLARFATDRAQASLERIEATAGGDARPRSVGAVTHVDDRKDGLPILALASAGGRTLSAWGRDRRGKRGGGAMLLLCVVGGVLAVAVYSGRIQVKKLEGEIKGATSAVSSAAVAVSSAVSSVSSAMASSLPPLPPLPAVSTIPIDEPSSSASASASADPEGEADEEGTSEPTAPSAVAGPSTPAAPRTVPAKPHPSKPHHASKPYRRHH